MTTRQTNFTLWSAAAALCAIAAFAIGLAWFLPLASPDPISGTGPTNPPANHRATPGTAPATQPFDAQLARAVALSLRRPLTDAAAESTPARGAAGTTAAVKPQATQPAPSALRLTLVGTIGQSLAMLRTADGSVEVCGVGETVGGAEVVSVRPRRVEVRINGQLVALTKADADATDEPPTPEQPQTRLPNR